jgi:3-phosphoshikimate 1-carboxyvinyltransferase
VRRFITSTDSGYDQKSENKQVIIVASLVSNDSLVNTSNSDDSEVMQMALNGAEEVIDIHHAGTAMRFLTAYFAVQETERLL